MLLGFGGFLWFLQEDWEGCSVQWGDSKYKSVGPEMRFRLCGRAMCMFTTVIVVCLVCVSLGGCSRVYVVSPVGASMCQPW